MHTILFRAHTPCMNYVTNTFLLVNSSVRSKQLLCFMHGQGQKSEQKHTTKNFVGFHNHSPPLTMVNPITWFPDKEVIYVALVISTLPQPLLCGENHLFTTQALSDHTNKAVTFRAPFISFIISLDKHQLHRTFKLQLPAFSLENQIANSCLPATVSVYLTGVVS